MRASIAARTWRWMRAYLVALLLVGGLALSLARTVAGTVGPHAQHPPAGYVHQRTTTELQWSVGNRGGEVRVQLSTSPGFEELLLDEVPRRPVRELRDLEPGRTYYWRLVQGGSVADVSSFVVAPTALRYR